MSPRIATRRSLVHETTDKLTKSLDALAAEFVSEVLAIARRALEGAPGDELANSHENRHRVQRLRALQRAVKWQLQLETGQVRSKAEIARREGITRSAVTQTLHLLDRLAQNEDVPLAATDVVPDRMRGALKVNDGVRLQGYRPLRRQVLLRFEADYIAATLRAASGNISMAARIARIDRKHLWRIAQRTGVRYDGET